MNWLKFACGFAGWALLIPLWLATFLVGIPLVLVQALARRFHNSSFGFRWDDRWMHPWQTPDNGCCAHWYAKRFSERRLWLNVWIWSAFRNPVGGDLFSRKVDGRLVKWRGTSPSPAVAALSTGKFQWHVALAGLTPAVWAVWPLKRRSASDHFEVRLGWKLRPGVPGRQLARFTPWDVGRRIH